MLNVELLQRVMTFIKDNPGKHDQTIWWNKCGTAGCFAGWTCTLSGDEIDIQEYFDFDTITVRPRMGSEVYTPRHRARQLLGITSDEASRLFDVTNTIEQLEFVVKDLCNGV